MINKFFKLFDKTKFISVFKIFLIFLFLVIIFNIGFTSFSKYESQGTISSRADVALFLVNESVVSKTIFLDELIPQDDAFSYVINISNYDNDGYIANVDLEYEIDITTTTNLPLRFELIDNENLSGGNVLETPVLETDADVYYKKYTIDNTKTFLHDVRTLDQYTLKVYFDSSYKDYPSKYQGIIDLIVITVKAKQLV